MPDAMETTPASAVAKVALVIDTNFLLRNLPVLKELHELGPRYGHVIVIPWAVVQELDGIKKYKDAVAFAARTATRWLYELFAASDHYIVGQRIKDRLPEYKFTSGDDLILECCLFYKEIKQVSTVLLSNDVNLCNKTLINDIPTVTYVEGSTTAKVIAENVRRVAGDRYADIGEPGDLVKDSLSFIGYRQTPEKKPKKPVQPELIKEKQRIAERELEPANNLRIEQLDAELRAYFDADVDMEDLPGEPQEPEQKPQEANFSVGRIDGQPHKPIKSHRKPALNSSKHSKHRETSPDKIRTAMGAEWPVAIPKQPAAMAAASTRKHHSRTRDNNVSAKAALATSRYSHPDRDKAPVSTKPPIPFDKLSKDSKGSSDDQSAVKSEPVSKDNGPATQTATRKLNPDPNQPPISFDKLSKNKKRSSEDTPAVKPEPQSAPIPERTLPEPVQTTQVKTEPTSDPPADLTPPISFDKLKKRRKKPRKNSN